MPEHLLKVFVVDDDPIARTLNAFLMLSPDVDISEFSDGDSCLEAVASAPDIIVLDVEMPGTDGIAVCRLLRLCGRTDAEIIFVSVHGDAKTRMAAHDAGGTDYIVKPYAAQHLIDRVEVAKHAIRARRQVAEHLDASRQAASAPASVQEDMGMLMAFSHCRTPQELGLACCHALEQYGLHGLITLHQARDHHCWSSRGRLTALETALLDDAHGLDRIFRFHDRLTIEFPHATLLIPNLPPPEHERAIRLRRYLTLLVKSADMHFAAMSNAAAGFPDPLAGPPLAGDDLRYPQAVMAARAAI